MQKMKCLILFLIVLFMGTMSSSCKKTTEPDGDGIVGKMIKVPAGSFDMGATVGLGHVGEFPVHEVNLRSFYIGKYEVTQGEFEAVMEQNPSIGLGPGSVGKTMPVFRTSWYHAIKYCNLLSIKKGYTPVYSINGSTNTDDWGRVPLSSNDDWNQVICDWNANGFRLPTEAEWEYAARAGKRAPDYLYSGSDNADKVAWYEDNSDQCVKAVGQKGGNGLSIFDMSGNVSEWCWDWFDIDYYSESPTDNPTGPETGRRRVTRGGSWYDMDYQTEVKFRNYNIMPQTQTIRTGFRLCRNAS